eukprot:NODE_11982_length_528_cov_62.229630_g11694_i0.p2 GENE.NODE_11982_length_528_cov_62.229630_g11694_i0~~NODE_11982_length_528_cov_62.229630_g11694_i0.p2  ORF type:complete len:124 (+),score=29.09 NODE_11982_length_528_cov_62.229630_g11694_i0:61-432(+)
MSRYEFQRIRKSPPTLHWDADNRFENLSRESWESKLVDSGKISYWQRRMFMTGFARSAAFCLFGVVAAWPFVMEFRRRRYGDAHDFRSENTAVRSIGGLEEADMYIVERMRAIDRVKARAQQA